MDKQELLKAADSTLTKNPKDKEQIVFIENHDTRRFASINDMIPEKSKVAASLNLLLGGIPLIYYGQEIGMKGKQMKGMTDGNDIPIREAFEWDADAKGEGMAFWYKNSGPWWDSTNVKANDGISLEEQRSDPQSLWNYYKKIIQLRKSNTALANGKYRAVENNNDNVFTFLRYTLKEEVLVMVNLSSTSQHADVKLKSDTNYKSAASLFNKDRISVDNSNRISIKISPFEVQVHKLNK